MLLAIMCEEVLEANLAVNRHRPDFFGSGNACGSSRIFQPERSGTTIAVANDDGSPVNSSRSFSKLRNEVVVSLVNPHSETDLDVTHTFRSAYPKHGHARFLHDFDWNAHHSFEAPNRAVPRSQS